MIEAARDEGANRADLAHLGVSSRQAAERRYLRLRAGEPGTTKEQRVQATRDQRAADHSVAAWAQNHAATLRQLAGTITGLPDLPDTAASAIDALHAALRDSFLGPSDYPADRTLTLADGSKESGPSEHYEGQARAEDPKPGVAGPSAAARPAARHPVRAQHAQPQTRLPSPQVLPPAVEPQQISGRLSRERTTCVQRPS